MRIDFGGGFDVLHEIEGNRIEAPKSSPFDSRRTLPDIQLSLYLDEINLVPRTHEICLPCSLKFLALCQSFPDSLLPERCARYSAEYKKLLPNYPGQHDFMSDFFGRLQCCLRLWGHLVCLHKPSKHP